MLSNLLYLDVPEKIIVSIIIFFAISNLIGEILEFKGKVVPEYIKMRKYFIRKKEERRVLSELPSLFEDFRQVPDTLKDVKKLLDAVEQHYNADNITKRDTWMNSVNAKLLDNDTWREEFDKKLDKNNEDTLSLLIENKRNSIIGFADRVVDEKNPVTREQFTRIFKIHKEYENMIKENNLTNGEVDIAIRIIRESYEEHLKHHTFVEDVRGY